MKLLKQVKLFFKEGNSDKIYEIDLCEISSEKHVVNFRYGKRGSVLKEGTKTEQYVSLDSAKSIFNELEMEKRKKGYNSDIEIFVEIPVIEAGEYIGKKGVLLKRLEDAVNGSTVFKTKWKTSRVIWYAMEENIVEAEPYILKLIFKGDDFQTQACLRALIKFKSAKSSEVFNFVLDSNRQKTFLKLTAACGLVLASENPDSTIQKLSTFIDSESRFHLENKNYIELIQHLKEKIQNNISTNDLSWLYIISHFNTELRKNLVALIHNFELKPPYFKHVRSILKLSDILEDVKTFTKLFIKIEQTPPFYNRTGSLTKQGKHYVNAINAYINYLKENKSEMPRIAFSDHTKNYLSKLIYNKLKTYIQQENALGFVQLSVELMLSYKETHFKQGGEIEDNKFGQYDWNSKNYLYTVFKRPDCYQLTTLQRILHGEENKLLFQKNGNAYFQKNEYLSDSYIFDINKIKLKKSSEDRNSKPSNKEANLLDSVSENIKEKLSGFFKSILGKPKTEDPEQNYQKTTDENTNSIAIETEPVFHVWKPEYWNQHPSAFVKLLQNAELKTVLDFAILSIHKHEKKQEIISSCNFENFIKLACRSLPQAESFASEIWSYKKEEIYNNPEQLAITLNTAFSSIQEEIVFYLELNQLKYNDNSTFWALVSFNNSSSLSHKIDLLIGKNSNDFTILETILNVLTSEKLKYSFSGEQIKSACSRVTRLFGTELYRISEELTLNLIQDNNRDVRKMGAEILLEKENGNKKIAQPEKLVLSYLKDDNIEIRQTGVKLLNYFFNEDSSYTDTLIHEILNLSNKDVVEVLCLKFTKSDNLLFKKSFIDSAGGVWMCAEKYEGSHEDLRNATETYHGDWNLMLTPRTLIRLILAKSRATQLLGYRILTKWKDFSQFTFPQISVLASHDLFCIRNWAWNFYNEHTERVLAEKNMSMTILDSKVTDSREFAFKYFSERFDHTFWDSETLIKVLDSVRPDVEAFGRSIVLKYFNPTKDLEMLIQLSEHPSERMQLFVTTYLDEFISQNPNYLKNMIPFYKSVLCRVNKSRVAKNRVYQFLHKVALNDKSNANLILALIDDLSAQSNIMDKATCIQILTSLKKKYPDLNNSIQLA